MALILGVVGYQVGDSSGLQNRLPENEYADLALNFGAVILIGAIIGWLVGGLVGKLLQRSLPRLSDRAAARSGAELLVGALGLIVGLGVSVLVSIPVSRLEPIGVYLMVPITLIVSYVAAELAARKHAEMLRLFGVRSPQASSTRSKLLDTSAIIDARIADVAAAGFIEGTLIVPLFVLEELQHIADSSDALRRARGRRGLEVVTRLRRERRLVTIDEDPADVQHVDAKLVRLAVRHGHAIVTTDHNLAKVAGVQSVVTLNLNALANALKPDFVAGERIRLKVLKQGKEATQGVGYLDDGTMVVVDQGRDAIGQEVDVVVTSVLQSSSGKLVFGRRDASSGTQVASGG